MKNYESNEMRKRRLALNINAAILSVVFFAILIFATLFAYRAPWTYDMTNDKVFTLTEQTLEVLNQNDQIVNIAAVYQEGKEDQLVKSLLKEYEKASHGRIKVSYIDAEKNPGLLNQYNLDIKAVINGSILFDCEGRSKLITSNALYSSAASGLAFGGEQQISGAISYVTAKQLPKIYFIEGHEEVSVQGDFLKIKEKLELESYEVSRLNLLREATIPEDASLLIIASPKNDYSVDEAKLLETYLSNGGRAIFLFDVLNVNEGLENIKNVLVKFGVSFMNNFVVEENPSYYYSTNKINIIPNMGMHEITADLLDAKMYVVLPAAVGLMQVLENDDVLNVETLLQSTPSSWVRLDVTINDVAKTDQDLNGPIDVAFAVKKSNFEDRNKDTKIVIVGNSNFLLDQNVETQGNLDFFINSVKWVRDVKDSNTIRPKLVNADRLEIKGDDFIRLAILSVVFIPAVVFGAGIVLWFHRRNL